MTLAKGLGSGVPIGACVAQGAAADVFTPGKHGSTFGGNPLASTAGLTTLNAIQNERLRENAQQMGDLICNGLRKALNGVAGVIVIRNAGLMIGIEMDRPCADLVKIALEDRLLINVTAEKVVRLLPPLVINQAEANELVSRLAKLIKDFLQQK
jgi:acetylornithine aminotransferase